MRVAVTIALICLKSSCGLLYNLGKVTYKEKEDENQQIDFRYTFKPNWRVIDLLKPPEFQGIPGFDLEARKGEYVRKNITPTFIAERAPSANREDLWELLEEYDMTYLNQLEWLKRTNKRYIGDNLVVCPADKFDEYLGKPFDISSIISKAKNAEDAVRTVLRVICANGELADEGVLMLDNETKVLHDSFRALYEKTYRAREKKRLAGVRAAASRGAYKGRKRLPIDSLILKEVIDQYEAGKIDADDAARKLGIGESTFYRRLKESRMKRAEQQVD